MNTDNQGGRIQEGPILVPVDFSADARAALTWACKLADLLQASVRVLHVVHDPAEAPGYYRIEKKDWRRPMEAVAAEMLGKFLGEMRAADAQNQALSGAETMLVVGLPVTRILEVADKVGARMIVMGSQGRTGLAHLLLGSKAEQVVRIAKVPVTIVKAQKK